MRQTPIPASSLCRLTTPSSSFPLSGEAVVLRGRDPACGLPPACHLTNNCHVALPLSGMTQVRARGETCPLHVYRHARFMFIDMPMSYARPAIMQSPRVHAV